MSTTKPGNAEKVAAIKAILEAAKTELNLIEQICLKDTDIGKNEEVIRAKENLCCLMAPPMSVPKRPDNAPSESGGITQEQLDAAQAAQAEAEKEAAKAKAEKGVAEKEATDAKAIAAKAKADAAAAIAATGGDQAAKDTAQTDIDEAIAAAVEAAKAAAQVEIDAANARAEAAESGGVDENLKGAAIAAAKQIVADKLNKDNIKKGEPGLKEQKIQNYSTKFLPFPKIIQIMTTYIQKQIDPSFKATILANGMVIFTKEPNAASGALGVVQWAIPSKPADVVGYKPEDMTVTGKQAPLTSELVDKVKARRAVVNDSIQASAEASVGAQPAGAPNGGTPGTPKEAQPAGAPTGVSKGAQPAGAPKGGTPGTPKEAQPAGAPKGSGTQLKAPTGESKGARPAQARTGITPGSDLREDPSEAPTAQLPPSELAKRKKEEGARAAAAKPAQPAAERGRTGGLRRSKRTTRS